jgi:hypothetical protein
MGQRRRADKPPRALCSLLAILATTVLCAADARPDPISLGILRRDGIVIPFAAFDGKRWNNPWPPATSADLEVPITLSSVPKRWWGAVGPVGEWQVWTGGDPRTVRVVQPDWVDVHCARQVALRTDYRSAEPPPERRTQPYPKDGLAVWPAQAIERVQILAPDDPEAKALRDALRDAFNRAERDTADRFAHPVKEKTREAIGPNIEALYAFGQSPRLYYVEATRGYRSDSFRERDCAIAFGTGWFMRSDAGMKRIDMAVDVLQCDRYGATYMLPLGVLRVGERIFWVAQYSGWDHERFVVVEVKKDKVEAVVSTWGGGC